MPPKRKVAKEVEAEQPDESPKKKTKESNDEAPKKRGKQPKKPTEEAVDEAEVVEEAPKKGRAKKEAAAPKKTKAKKPAAKEADDDEEQAVEEPEPAAPKRGKSKKAAAEPVEKAPRARRAAAAKESVVDEDSEPEAPKKRSRAPKKQAETNGDAAPKKRGRKPAAKADKANDVDGNEEAVKPKKKGRGAAAKDDEDVSEEAVEPKKKGRAAKADKESDEDATEEAVESKKKGRAAKADKVSDEEDDGTEEVVEPKKKGRAPAKKTAAAKKAKQDEEEEPEAKEPVNETDTKWEEVQVTTEKLNSKDETSNMTITSWNVDGLRAWLRKGGISIFQHAKPDIICLQETKCSEDKLPEEIKQLDGYKSYWCTSSKDGYAGVGLLSKVMPIEVKYGIEDEEQDEDGRCITAEFEKFFVVGVYVPNAGRKLVTLPKRLNWNDSFKAYIKKLNDVKPVIICGDMNVAHSEIDLSNPKTNKKNAGFTQEERDGMTDFLEQGYVDVYRRLYPDVKDVYTFWTYMMKARSKNVGWRLDYFIIPETFMKNVCDVLIHTKVFGSDHCPLSLYLHI